MHWKSTTWNRSLKGNRKSEHLGLWHEERSDGYILGSVSKRYKMTANKNTMVLIASEDLSDNLAWISYIDYFQKVSQGKVRICTPYKSFLETSYSNLEFFDILGEYKSVWHIPSIKNKVENLVCLGGDNPTTGINLKGSDSAIGTGLVFGVDKDGNLARAGRIIDRYAAKRKKGSEDLDTRQMEAVIKLGFKAYKEIPPTLLIPLQEPPTTSPYVTISIHAENKDLCWNNPTGWQDLVDYLVSLGYVVVAIDDQNISIPKKVLNSTGKFKLSHKASQLKQAKFHIGVKSDLSWLSWAVGTPTLTISSEYPEFERNSVHVVTDQDSESIKFSEVKSAVDVLIEAIDNGKFN